MYKFTIIWAKYNNRSGFLLKERRVKFYFDRNDDHGGQQYILIFFGYLVADEKIKII